MHITKHYVHAFRNLGEIHLDPSPFLNIFIGDNGQGKTNLLESIALGLSLKPIHSFKQNADLIRHGDEQAFVRIHLSDPPSSPPVVSLHISSKGKSAKLNDKSIRDASAIASVAPLVVFVPDDLQIVLGSSSLRRRFLDQVTANLYPSYIKLYREYDRALLGRNQLLKSSTLDLAQLDAFTSVVVDRGTCLVDMRLRAMHLWLPFFREALQTISGDTLRCELTYQGSFGATTKTDAIPSLQELREQFTVRLKETTREERLRKSTLCGPHLDDLCIILHDLMARQSASRGQARTIVLALKMAHLQTVHAHREVAPILLLDDVVGELDEANAARLLETIRELKAQTFLTTTHLTVLPKAWQSYPFRELRAGTIPLS